MTVQYDSRSVELEGLATGKLWIVEFDQCIYVVDFFDFVDYSIYERGDMMVFGVVEQIGGDNELRSGTMLEFSVADVRTVTEKDTGIAVYGIDRERHIT
tara:strand:- start:194 stop:490 length:297 start_codon:yes stop_codon:yes gene_type:complete